MQKNSPCYLDPEWIQPGNETLDADIVVYGGTAAGVVAAVTAARRGFSAVLLHPGQFLGGMTTGGLSRTDVGNKAVIGGAARQFYRDCGQRYGVEEDWTFEPHVAAEVLQGMIEGADLVVRYAAFLEDVELETGRICRLRMLGGLRVQGRMFIDATYEGDLMAAAGIPFTTGREGNDVYGETCNGVQVREQHQFRNVVDPYAVEGLPATGLLPFVEPGPIEPDGTGDGRIQAYNFRVCMTDDPAKKKPFPKPRNFNPDYYRLVTRWLRDPQTDVFTKFDRIRGGKTDTNNHGAASTDFIGANYDWPEGDYERREETFQSHVSYQQGLHWFMANDESVPREIREEYSRWGLAADEFVKTGNWPHQLYIREGRRMVSDYVVTEHDCLGHRACEDPVGMGAYQMDSHNCRRFVRDGRVLNEGDVQVRLPEPYGVSYRAIIPPRGSVENMAVPVAMSASHIAFGSVRMEPVFMILAESAAIAACLAADENAALQDLPYSSLRQELLAAGQVLETRASNQGSEMNPAR